MKIIWARHLVPKAEKLGFITKVQFGNRNGVTALNILLLKVTTMDSIHLFCFNGTILNNDAVACYDCMIPSLISIDFQSLGLPEKAAECS
eukprot:12719923-Ditylum_brightwellii.AAC.1